MNVTLYDRRVHAKFLAIFQTQIHCRLHDQLIDGLQRLRSQPVKGTVESTVLRHRLAIEIRELPQSVPVSDPFAQLAKIPILDALEDQGAQNLLGGQSIATGPGIFQTLFQITSYGLDHLFVVVQKIGDALQHRLQQNALLQQLPIGSVSALPLTGEVGWGQINVEGYAPPPGQELQADIRVASTDYFRTMKIPLRKGRFFTEDDTADKPQVVIIDETFAQRFWPDSDPIGKHLWWDPKKPVTIVGVVGVVKQ